MTPEEIQALIDAAVSPLAARIVELEARPVLSADFENVDLAALVSDMAAAQAQLAELTDPDNPAIGAGYANAEWADTVLGKYFHNDRPQ